MCISNEISWRWSWNFKKSRIYLISNIKSLTNSVISIKQILMKILFCLSMSASTVLINVFNLTFIFLSIIYNSFINSLISTVTFNMIFFFMINFRLCFSNFNAYNSSLNFDFIQTLYLQRKIVLVMLKLLFVKLKTKFKLKLIAELNLWKAIKIDSTRNLLIIR